MPGWDWEFVKSVFAKATTVPEEELDGLLADLCCGDAEMAAFVRSLVINDRDSDVPRSAGKRVFTDGAMVAGRLRIVRFIDRGAMGEVYEAYDERLRQSVALKTVLGELVRSPDMRARFEREIRIAREVAHENLCRVFDYIEEDQRIPCYTMELVKGESLAALLERERPLNTATALALIQQIACGLDALHRRGIIHRDLKPSNIMLTPGERPRVVLMDFGLAKLLDPADDLFQTRVEQQAGAPYFMAPELLKNGSPSVASDLYAFGLITDEMVTCSRAFAAQSLQSLYFAKLWETPIPPGERNAALPPNWQAAIVKCIAGEPEERFPSAGAMVEALESVNAIALPASGGKRLPAWRPGLRRALAPIAARPVAAGSAGVAVLGCGIFLTLAVNAPAALATVRVYDLENATGNAAMNYLCKGTANELIRRFTRMSGIRAVPMHETRQRGTILRSDDIAVEGTVDVSGDRVRIAVLLTDGRTGQVFDTETLEALPGDSLRTENELAGHTANKVESQLLARSAASGGAFAPIMSKLRIGLFRRSDHAGSGPTTNGPAFDFVSAGQTVAR